MITVSGTPTASGTFNYSIPLTGGCGTVAASGTITVLPTETAAFSYASSTYCETDSDPTPNNTGTTGGTYSATPSGLSINASTGAIDLDASTMGTYAVKYVTSSSICADSTTVNVTITATNTVSTNGAYDISTASYVQEFSVASQETSPRGIRFNSDGTKMFVVGQSKYVYEYNLTTSFDISTANYAGNAERFYVGNEEGIPLGMAFNNDGTKMYIIGMSGDEVNEYTLSTGFDVSTATYTQLFSVSAQETNPMGMAFNNDGTKMYVFGTTGKDVNEYVLSIGFDVSTAAYSQVFSVASQEAAPSGIVFNDDGTKMFVIGFDGDEVNEYSLTTAFDVSTASHVQVFSVATQENQPTGISFNNDATKMYVLGNDGNDVTEYSLDNPAVQTVCLNEAITNITYNTTGATGIGTPTDLPTGVTAAWSSNVITVSGTPTASGTFNYSIPLSGGCGTVAATGTITVNDLNTAAAPSASPTVCLNTALTDVTIATTGATGIGTATDLPAGVIASWASDVITISGTPTVAGTYNYSIPLTGGCGSVNATGTITVSGDNLYVMNSYF